MNDTQDKRIAELERQLAEAKEDAERLDYLDLAIGYDPLQIAWNDDYSNCWSLHSKQIGTTGRTLREAIDAARKETLDGDLCR